MADACMTPDSILAKSQAALTRHGSSTLATRFSSPPCTNRSATQSGRSRTSFRVTRQLSSKSVTSACRSELSCGPRCQQNRMSLESPWLTSLPQPGVPTEKHGSPSFGMRHPVQPCHDLIEICLVEMRRSSRPNAARENRWRQVPSTCAGRQSGAMRNTDPFHGIAGS